MRFGRSSPLVRLIKLVLRSSIQWFSNQLHHPPLSSLEATSRSQSFLTTRRESFTKILEWLVGEASQHKISSRSRRSTECWKFFIAPDTPRNQRDDWKVRQEKKWNADEFDLFCRQILGLFLSQKLVTGFKKDKHALLFWCVSITMVLKYYLWW